MNVIGLLPILIDASRMRRVKIVCKCGNPWTEAVPAEIHDSWLVMAFFCPSCGQEYHLQNKKLERAAVPSKTMPKADSFPPAAQGGNA